MFSFSPGCYHIKRKPSLSEYSGDLDSRGSTDLWPNKRAQSVSQSAYEAKLDRPRRIYPVRTYNKSGRLVAYHSGDVIEGKALAPTEELESNPDLKRYPVGPDPYTPIVDEERK